MNAERTERAYAWLQTVGEWAGDRRRAGLACEVVRGIVDVSDPEYAYAVAWAGGEPTVADWHTALELYGPVLPDDVRRSRADTLYSAALVREGRKVRELVR